MYAHILGMKLPFRFYYCSILTLVLFHKSILQQSCKEDPLFELHLAVHKWIFWGDHVPQCNASYHIVTIIVESYQVVQNSAALTWISWNVLCISLIQNPVAVESHRQTISHHSLKPQCRPTLTFPKCFSSVTTSFSNSEAEQQQVEFNPPVQPRPFHKLHWTGNSAS